MIKSFIFYVFLFGAYSNAQMVSSRLGGRFEPFSGKIVEQFKESPVKEFVEARTSFGKMLIGLVKSYKSVLKLVSSARSPSIALTEDDFIEREEKKQALLHPLEESAGSSLSSFIEPEQPDFKPDSSNSNQYDHVIPVICLPGNDDNSGEGNVATETEKVFEVELESNWGKLGSGTYGSVDSVKSTNHSQAKEFELVIKHTLQYHLIDPVVLNRIFSDYDREARVLEHFEHPFIPKCFGLYYLDPNAFRKYKLSKKRPPGEFFFFGIMMEKTKGCQLRKFLELSGKFKPEFLPCVVMSILLPIDYLHHLGFIHGDIKPGNLVIDESLYFTNLIDFGGTCQNGISKDSTYTRAYLPPECFKGTQDPTSPGDSSCSTRVYSSENDSNLEHVSIRKDFRRTFAQDAWAAGKTIKEILGEPSATFSKAELRRYNAMLAVANGLLIEDPQKRFTIEQAIVSLDWALSSSKRQFLNSFLMAMCDKLKDRVSPAYEQLERIKAILKKDSQV